MDHREGAFGGHPRNAYGRVVIVVALVVAVFVGYNIGGSPPVSRSLASLSGIYSVPASVTAVGATVGPGPATGTLDGALMFAVLPPWIVTPWWQF